ncbi:hypothetical protein BGZ73_000288 [Actinomortierella ambigua]|nr:hypothetical protein BGZ73_000288 [Actinomortierella ambigua]
MNEPKAQGPSSHGPSNHQGHSQTRPPGKGPPPTASSVVVQPLPAQEADTPTFTPVSPKPIVTDKELSASSAATTITTTTASLSAPSMAASMEPKRKQPLDTLPSFSSVDPTTLPVKTPELTITTDPPGPRSEPATQRSPGSPASPGGSTSLTRSSSKVALRHNITSGMLASPTAIPPGAYITGFMAGPSHPVVVRSPTSSSFDSKRSTVSESLPFLPVTRVKSKGKNKEKDKDKKKDVEKDKGKKDKDKAKDKVKDKDKDKEKDKDKKKSDSVGPRPIYSLGTMGFGAPIRSFSYTGPNTSDHLLVPSTAGSTPLLRKNSTIGASGLSSHTVASSSSSIRKSQSVGKAAAKKGFTTRLRKLRKRQGSASRDSSVHALVTSGESDSEAGPERFYNNGGHSGYQSYANYMVPFRPQRTRTLRSAGEADLPPPPPLRTGSADSKVSSAGSAPDLIPSACIIPQTSMGIAPFSVITRTPATGELSQPSTTERESSSIRFKDLLKRNVSSSNNNLFHHSPLSTGSPRSASSTSTPTVSSSKRGGLSRGAAFWSDFLSGDDAPGGSNLAHERARSSTTRFSVSRLSASGRRKRRLTKKQLQAEEAAMMLSTSPHTDDEDLQAAAAAVAAAASGGRTGRRRPHHYQQWFQHLNRHRSQSADTGARAARLALATGSVAGPFPMGGADDEGSLSAPLERPAISNRLQEAREATTGPNTLVAELEPVPLAFKYALHRKIPVTSLLPLQSKAPAAAPATISTGMDEAGGVGGGGAGASDLGGTAGLLGASGASGVSASSGSGGLGIGSGMVSPGLDFGATAQYHYSGDKTNPLAGKSFLFMAYQNSKFHRFYTFRVQGDTIQYAKLPVALEQGCLHYFRTASITYRRLEQSAKEFREKKRQALENWLRIDKEAQLQLGRALLRSTSTASRRSSVNIQQQQQQQQAQQQLQPQHQNRDTLTVGGTSNENGRLDKSAETAIILPCAQNSMVESPRDEEPSEGAKSPSTGSLGSSSVASRSTSPASPASTASEVDGLQQMVQRYQEFRLDDGGEDPAAPRSRRASMDDELIAHRTLSMTPDNDPANNKNTKHNDKNSNDKEAVARRGDGHHQGLRRATLGPTVHSNIPVVMTPPNDTNSGLRKEGETVAEAAVPATITSSPPPMIQITPSDSNNSNNNTLQVPGQQSPRHQSPTSPLSPSSSSTTTVRHRKRSWSNLRERQRQDQAEHRRRMVRQQRMAEEMLWQQRERTLCQEAKQATYGLDLFLWEILKNVEYDKFENVADVAIANENRDSTLFSIVNGDRTNLMWLESPSAKLKQEFLNWIAVALMDYSGEPEPEGFEQTSLYCRQHCAESLARWIEHQSSSDLGHKEHGPIDLLLDMTSLKVTELETALTTRRQGCERAMREMDDCLRKLDELDRQAEKLKHVVLDAVGSQEVQKALQPAPNTDKTLAQTVEAKLNDVNERIVFVTKVMVSARYDLNRLRYEIELEHRSIRLFRQYKIVIAVVTIAALLCLWYLYYQRSVAMHAGPAAALFPEDQQYEGDPLPPSPVLCASSSSSSSWTSILGRDPTLKLTTHGSVSSLSSSFSLPVTPSSIGLVRAIENVFQCAATTK